MTPTPTVATAGDVFGAQLFGDESNDSAILDRMSQGRVEQIRIPVQWQWIEVTDTSPPSYNWAWLDAVANALNSRSITPVAVLYTKPAWAASQSCGPVDLVPISRYEDYIRAMVERYDNDGVDDAPGRAIIKFWEIENEADFNPAQSGGAGDHGSCFGGSPGDAEYAELLRSAYKAAKSADSESTIIFGGVAYDRFYNKSGYSPPGGPFDYHFVENAMDEIETNYGSDPDAPFFDWIGIHVYNDFRDNWDGAHYKQELKGKLDHFRRNQLPVAWRSMPLAITEVGLSSNPSDQWTDRSDAIQAQYPGRVLARAISEGSPSVQWFVGKDRFYGDCADIYAWQTFGLIASTDVSSRAAACATNPIPNYNPSAENEPKDVHTAYKVVQDQVAGKDFDATLSLAKTGSSLVEAYRFKTPAISDYTVIAFTDNGSPLGRIGVSEVSKMMIFNVSVLPDWTGKVRIVDHMGNETIRTAPGSGTWIGIDLGQAPLYISAVD